MLLIFCILSLGYIRHDCYLFLYKPNLYPKVSVSFSNSNQKLIMARLSCGVHCTRTILFLLNILFVIFGFTLLGFGIYIKVSKKLDIALSEHINTNIVGGDALAWVGIIIIIIAVFTILLSTFGCLGM